MSKHLVILLLLFTACGTPSDSEKVISTAESLIISYPDSAIRLLREMPSEYLHEEEIYHKYIVLSACGIIGKDEIPTDMKTQLSDAGKYFSHKGDRRHEMMVEFCLGILSAHTPPEAMNHLLNASELAAELSDTIYLGIVHREISALYSRYYNFFDASRHARLARNFLLAAGKTVEADNSLGMLAEALVSSNCFNQAAAYADSMIAVGINGRSDILADGYEMLGMAYAGDMKYQEAIKAFRSCLLADTAGCHPGALSAMGYSYYMLGDIDSAEVCFFRYCAIVDSVRMPYYLEEAKGHYKEALGLLKEKMAADDNSNLLSLGQSMTSAIIDRREREKNILGREARRQESLRIAITVVWAICVALSFIIMEYYRRDKERKVGEKEEESRLLLLELDSHRERLDTLNNAAMNVLKRSFESYDSISAGYYELAAIADERTRNRKLASMVQEQVEKFRNDPASADRLEDAVNRISGNLMRDFRSDFPDLAKEEYLLLLYSTAGISTPAKCALLGISSNALYSRKSRLKSRIRAAAPPRAEEYLSILG